jgi:peptidoglycan/xylan/chitin deacetylase (PgdA/CDA1 family)
MNAPAVRDGIRNLIPYVFLPVAYPEHLLRPAVRILMYHRVTRLPAYDQLTVTPERFEDQIAALKSRWNVVTLADALATLERGGPRAPTAVVTFDDGYLDNLVNALPVLRRHGVPATIFVTARFSDGSQRHPRYANEPGRLHLDWEEIATLAREPGISIGSHTLTHPYLTRLDDQTAEREVAGSRDEIAAHIGKDVDFFCYPSGDVTARERALVAAAGYRAAVSVCPGGNRDARDRFALRRTEVTERDGARALRLKLVGAYDLVHGLLHRRRERQFARARRSAHTAAAAAGSST